MTDYNFTPEQQKAYDTIMSGKNVFLTGNAGTGKSYVLNKVMEKLDELHLNYIASAPTGIAAFNVGGITLHSLLHIRPGILTGSPNYATREAWRDLFSKDGILIVDEISMCRMDLFEYLVKTILTTEQKMNSHIQVILVGDFYQLPPIVQSNEKKMYESFFTGKYAFESPFWNDLDLTNLVLHEEIRQTQSTDQEKWFVEALNHIRFNDQFAWNAINYINQQCYRPTLDRSGTYLCGYRSSVARINNEYLTDLKTNEINFHCHRDEKIAPSSSPADEIVHLKIGAKVMCLKNVVLEDGTEIYNGQRGTVVDAIAHGKRLKHSKTNLNATAPMPNIFTDSSSYGLEKLADIRNQNAVKVRFDGSELYPEQTVWISWEKWDKIEYKTNSSGHLEQKVIGSFVQIPLKLAYALTIHKAQGQTITGSVNLKSEIFEPGQLYVALSRVTSIKNLHLQSRLRPQDTIPNLKVTEFYRSIDPAMSNIDVHYDRNQMIQALGKIISNMPDRKLAQFVNLADMFSK